jgi:hypothetical protein
MSAALRQFARLTVWLFVFAAACLGAQNQEERKWVLYEVKVPEGCQSWVLSETARDAATLYRMRGSCDRPGFFEMWPAFWRSSDGMPRYGPATGGTMTWPNRWPPLKGLATRHAEGSVLISPPEGRTGWVAQELVDPTAIPEATAREAWEQEAMEARKAIFAKEQAAREAKAAESRAKENAYIRSLPKLWNNGARVFVATSMDCARDYQQVLRFGRANGTGVAYRKKILELVTLNCIVDVSSGTAIEVLKDGSELVDARLYTGPRKGTHAVVLKENVR